MYSDVWIRYMLRRYGSTDLKETSSVYDLDDASDSVQSPKKMSLADSSNAASESAKVNRNNQHEEDDSLSASLSIPKGV